MSERTDVRDPLEPERVVVTDRRRLDPETGEVRVQPEQAAAAYRVDGSVDGLADGSMNGGPAVQPPAPAGPGGQDGEAPDQVAELTLDLQRLSAEYANYRKRVERDRVTVGELAAAGVLSELLPLLDDVERARAHGDLHGAFKSVGEGLEALTVRLGLERYGAVGEPFDPQVHEAVMTAEPDPSAAVAVCAMVLQPGFSVRGRVLRPARVAVAEPGGEA